MRLLKAGLVQLLLVSALGLVFASQALALELPDVHVLSGETYPATSEGEVTGTEVGVLETELGEKLTSSGAKATLTLNELTETSPGTLTFTGVAEPRSKTSCNTSGDASGTVKLSGKWDAVFFDIILPFPIFGWIWLFSETTVECNSGKLKVKVRSPIAIKLEKVTSGTDVTEYGLVAKCSGKGKQEQKEYLNDEGKAVKAVPTMNFGLGFETACLNISKELVMKSSKMIDFLF